MMMMICIFAFVLFFFFSLYICCPLFFFFVFYVFYIDILCAVTASLSAVSCREATVCLMLAFLHFSNALYLFLYHLLYVILWRGDHTLSLHPVSYLFVSLCRLVLKSPVLL